MYEPWINAAGGLEIIREGESRNGYYSTLLGRYETEDAALGAAAEYEAVNS